MPRTCTICANAHRDDIDTRAAAGANSSALAAEFGLGERAVQRHVAAHLSQELRTAARETEQGNAAELLSRLIELADDAAAVRRASDGRVAVAAIAAERGVLETLLNRLGVDATTVADELEHGRTLIRLMSRVVRGHPEFGEYLALEASAIGDADAAEAFRTLATRATARLNQ